MVHCKNCPAVLALVYGGDVAVAVAVVAEAFFVAFVAEKGKVTTCHVCVKTQ